MDAGSNANAGRALAGMQIATTRHMPNDDVTARRPAAPTATEPETAQEGRLPQTSDAGARAGLRGHVWLIAALLVLIVVMWTFVL
jgi:hypothetical protein